MIFFELQIKIRLKFSSADFKKLILNKIFSPAKKFT